MKTKTPKTIAPVALGSPGRKERQEETKRILGELEKRGVSEVEIAFRLGTCIQSIWRWRREGRIPTQLYFRALKELATEKGVIHG